MTLQETLVLVLVAAPVSMALAVLAVFLAARLTPAPPRPAAPPPEPDLADRGELALMRAIAGAAPGLIWREAADGTVDWANSSYLDRACNGDLLDRGTQGWPLPRLFAGLDPATDRPQRLRLTRPDGKAGAWHEITTAPLGTGLLRFATEVEAVVEAERTRRDFVQTLAKTFAELAIGLAIFDRQRRLILFNPALTDLTGLAPGFLAGRPTLQTMLDRMREARRLPEPKNYATWRQEMAACEAEARRGGYRENWSLPNGQTLRVTGRPHPDGAVAFLFEDISADITLTRSFRAEIEASHAALDAMDGAVAVFAASGTMVLANRAYHDLWGLDDEALTAPTIHDQALLWQATCADPVPDAIALSASGTRSPCVTEIVPQGRGRWRLCLTPLVKGATMVRMDPLDARPELRRATG